MIKGEKKTKNKKTKRSYLSGFLGLKVNHFHYLGKFLYLHLLFQKISKIGVSFSF